MSRFVTRRLVSWQDDNGGEGWIRPGMKKWPTAGANVNPGHDLVDHATCDLSLAGELRALGALAFRIQYNPPGNFLYCRSSIDTVAIEISRAYKNAYDDLDANYDCKLLVTPKLSHWYEDYLDTIRAEADHQFTLWGQEYGLDMEYDVAPSRMDEAAYSHLVYGFAWALKRYADPNTMERLVNNARRLCADAWRVGGTDDGEARLTVTLDTESGTVDGTLRYGYGEVRQFTY